MQNVQGCFNACFSYGSIHQNITPLYSVQPQVHRTQGPGEETDFINRLKKIRKTKDTDTLQFSHVNKPKALKNEGFRRLRVLM